MVMRLEAKRAFDSKTVPLAHAPHQPAASRAQQHSARKLKKSSPRKTKAKSMTTGLKRRSKALGKRHGDMIGQDQHHDEVSSFLDADQV